MELSYLSDNFTLYEVVKIDFIITFEKGYYFCQGFSSICQISA